MLFKVTVLYLKVNFLLCIKWGKWGMFRRQIIVFELYSTTRCFRNYTWWYDQKVARNEFWIWKKNWVIMGHKVNIFELLSKYFHYVFLDLCLNRGIKKWAKVTFMDSEGKLWWTWRKWIIFLGKGGHFYIILYVFDVVKSILFFMNFRFSWSTIVNTRNHNISSK